MEAKRSDFTTMIAETEHATEVSEGSEEREPLSKNPELVPEPPRLLRSHRRQLLPPWFQRHWWVLVLCIVAGTGGGVVASSSQRVMYSSTAELIVASGASVAGPGPANDAIALALTDASIIPSDDSTLRRVAHETGTSLSEVAKSLSASAVSGTSVIVVSYKAASPSIAKKGVNAAARVLNNGTPDSAIPVNSLAIVHLAGSATPVGTLHSYGIPLGIILGLFVGALATLAIERADPRVDDVEDLAQVTGTAASAFPGPIPVIELERNIARASGGVANVTIAPLTAIEEDHAFTLQRDLMMSADRATLAFDVVGPVATKSALLAQSYGPTVLVVKPNTRSRSIQASVHRLQMMGRGPVWAVLAVGKSLPETGT